MTKKSSCTDYTFIQKELNEMKCVLCLQLLILFASILCIAGLPSFADGTSSEASQRIIAALQPFIDNHTLAGAVTLVASKDKTLSLEAVGYADIAARKPMKTDDLFWIASQSKPITASALMMLWDEGKFKLDDPVEKYLPEFRNQWMMVEQDNEHMLLKKPAHMIAIREIMSHTSGLPFSSAMEQPTLDCLPLKIAVESYAITPLMFEPGSQFQYANAGLNTAGRLIEVLSGMPYEKFLEDRLLRPLGMKDTTFWPNKEQLARLAKSYKPNAANDGLDETTITQLRYPLDDRHDRYPMPAGGLFSTARDVEHFCQMILNGGVYKGKRYLSEAAVREMTTKQTGSAVPAEYGLGWSTAGGNFGHGGAYSTNMNIDPNRGLITIFMVQHAGFPGDGSQSLGAFMKAANDLYDTIGTIKRK
jgi:CubicO group peptidase (beta-lactamase class C family)